MPTIDEYKQLIQANQATNIASASNYSNPKADLESAMIRLTDTSKELEDFEDYLRQRRKGQGGMYIHYGKPLLTEEGINELLAFLMPLLNKHTIMGFTDDKKLSAHLLYLADKLAKHLMTKRVAYGISVETRSIIYYEIMMISIQVMHRGLNEGDRRFWKGTVQEIKTTVDNPAKKGSFLAKAFSK